jgi:outer membrane protein OmpA-like peptidoglycan-associated protein
MMGSWCCARSPIEAETSGQGASSAAPEDETENDEDHRDHQKDLGEIGRQASDAAKAEKRRYQGDHRENNCPSEHVISPFSGRALPHRRKRTDAADEAAGSSCLDKASTPFRDESSCRNSGNGRARQAFHHHGEGAFCKIGFSLMLRSLLFLSAAFLAGAAVLSLQSCKGETEVAVERPGTSDDIVVLPDGATMVARSGSRDRAMAEWLTAARGEGEAFVFGDAAFIPGTARLSREGLGDGATLVTLLRATPDARLRLVGQADAADHVAGGDALARKRGEALAAFLVDRGIPADRLEIAPPASGHDPAGLLLFARRSAPAVPLLTASN